MEKGSAKRPGKKISVFQQKKTTLGGIGGVNDVKEGILQEKESAKPLSRGSGKKRGGRSSQTPTPSGGERNFTKGKKPLLHDSSRRG